MKNPEMNKSVIFSLLFLCCLSAQAQVVISMDQLERTINTELKYRLINAENGEGLSFASSYLIPVKDTLITNFAISDKDGNVNMKDVVPGEYELFVEMMGFKPYSQKVKVQGYQQELEDIKITPDEEFLTAATVSAVADPIVFDKDTIIYNAAAYRLGETAVLEDLLKMMPGMSVSEDGSVSVNGEKVDRITVGGKTFFFDDPSMTLKNLPAKFVDKIKVMDTQTKDAKFTGMNSKTDKEKVMDVQLKEEYKKGNFGNAKLFGGSALAGESESNLRANPGLLYNGSAMAASYNEMDQLTASANFKNASEPISGSSSVIMVSYSDDGYFENDLMADKKGIVTEGMAGVNYNTSRIKGMDSDLSVSYSYNRKDSKELSSRTSYRSDGNDLFSTGDFSGTGTDGKIRLTAGMEKSDQSKYRFELRPSLSFGSNSRSTSSLSSTSAQDGLINEGESINTAVGKSTELDLVAHFGIKDIGKKGRSIMLSSGVTLGGSRGKSSEISSTVFANGATDARNLLYDRNVSKNEYDLGITCTEPLGSKASIQANVSGNSRLNSMGKDAFNGNDGRANDYYSSYSRNRRSTIRENLRLQYIFKPGYTCNLGVTSYQILSEVESRTLGVEKKSGQGEWTTRWMPNATININKEKLMCYLYYSGTSSVPGGDRINPSLDLSNPLQLSVGNIYLRPTFTHYGNLQLRYSDRKSAFSITGSANLTLEQNALVFANWFDSKGIRYAIPVNSQSPGSNLSASIYLNTPIGKSRNFTYTLSLSASQRKAVSYQATGRLEGFDLEHFDYNAMMEQFWGNAEGSRFYSGESGFATSYTNTTRAGFNTSLNYRKDALSCSIGASGESSVNRFSLDPSANTNIRNLNVNGNVGYIGDKGLNLQARCYYQIYRGYSEGFNREQFVLNLAIAKTVKSVTFSLQMADALNQNSNFTHTANAEYVEDVFHNSLGRFILAGVSFNFGKMNAKNNNKAQSALFNMLF